MMTRDEAIRRFEKQLTDARVVLDSGFGTREGEHNTVYRHRKEMAEIALDALHRTAEHDKAMEEGRLVELPCKECFSEAGNNVYLIYSGEVVEVVHCGLSICPVSGNPYIALCAEDKIFPYREGDAEHDTDPTDWCANGCDVAAADFGKTVFLTRQEAEEAMQKKNKEYPCRGHECYDRGNFHASCGECPLYGKEAALDGGGEQC